MLDNIEENERIPYICRLMYEAYRIPAVWLNTEGAAEQALPQAYGARPPVEDGKRLLAEVLEITQDAAGSGQAAVKAAVPLIRTTAYLENFIILPLAGAPEHAGSIVLGPSLYASLTEENAASLLRDHNLPPGRQEGWLQYYRGLPVLDRMRLYHAAMLLHTLVTGQALPISELLPESQALRPVQLEDSGPDLNLSYRRENTWLHHDPSQERELFRHIRNGDKDGLLQAHAGFPEDQFGLLSKKSQLRSKKNLAVSSITLATRAAIDGGLFWEIAYTLSDFHIQHIEELHDIPAVDRAQLAALCDFADQVKDSRRSKLSRTPALCQNYIFNHLYEELTLGRLAGVVGQNASYLSQQFKKETGFTVSDYIRRERIEEAKRLMELPGVSLSDIAIRLHFNDQSYFTKVFKKYTGMTPRQFRHDRGII
ncbi:helix-turn-helix domain-containing protein [Paenibacillus sp. S150]|uniref:helix-turn-helix domain-containing protein n=1 Tax=Paenibacillus sp. S150 TaxID=2749826 RepID=UPI001C58CB40|nr:helix-turn-helix domain-containing protein [Paenibacillus sp. S150]MBW4085551.1 helix-turn-helix domain-containing protein [Paenibacillus sp. S150]